MCEVKKEGIRQCTTIYNIYASFATEWGENNITTYIYVFNSNCIK